MERGKKRGSLTYEEINAVFENVEDVNPERIDELFEEIAAMNIEIVDEQKEEKPAQDGSDDNAADTLPAGLSLDDPVRMYLKEIGRVPLLSMDDEKRLAMAIEAGELEAEATPATEPSRWKATYCSQTHPRGRRLSAPGESRSPRECAPESLSVSLHGADCVHGEHFALGSNAFGQIALGLKLDRLHSERRQQRAIRDERKAATGGEPGVTENVLLYAHDNVATLAADPRSIFNLYRALITLRRTTPALMAGSYAPVATTSDLLAYKREYAGSALLIVLNLGAERISIGSDTMVFSGEILLSTRLDRADETVSGGLVLRGDEGLIIRLQ